MFDDFNFCGSDGSFDGSFDSGNDPSFGMSDVNNDFSGNMSGANNDISGNMSVSNNDYSNTGFGNDSSSILETDAFNEASGSSAGSIDVSFGMGNTFNSSIDNSDQTNVHNLDRSDHTGQERSYDESREGFLVPSDGYLILMREAGKAISAGIENAMDMTGKAVDTVESTLFNIVTPIIDSTNDSNGNSVNPILESASDAVHKVQEVVQEVAQDVAKSAKEGDPNLPPDTPLWIKIS